MREWLSKEAFAKEHAEYLKTNEWRALRRKALQRDGGRCQACECREAEVVHHVTYARWRRERLSDLVSLCRECHEREHKATHRKAPTVSCEMCGRVHGADGRMLYVAWWFDPEEDRITHAGIFCNGRGECRDKMHAQLNADRRPEWTHRFRLRDLPATSFFGDGGLRKMADFMSSDRWLIETSHRMVRICRALAEVDSQQPSFREDWFYDGELEKCEDEECDMPLAWYDL